VGSQILQGEVAILEVQGAIDVLNFIQEVASVMRPFAVCTAATCCCYCLHDCECELVRWERRVDPHCRVYYVDHNTRTTTWQRPSVDLMNNLEQFHQMRQNRQMDQLANRFLYPQQQSAASNDPLGPLPEGWGA